MKRALTILLPTLMACVASVHAQTPAIKEAMNTLAKYSSSKNIKELESARKLIDDAYKTKSDSAAFRNNLVRSLVYSTLARADSNLILKYTKDPVDETLYSLNLARNSKSAGEASTQIDYINDQLKHVYLYRANSSFKSRRFTEALKYFTLLDSIDKSNLSITHNLALLHQELGNYSKSITFYEKLVSQKPKPEYYLVLANLYESIGDERNLLSTLKEGSDAYPANRDLIFKLINSLVHGNDYAGIAQFIERALKLDEFNVNLNYLAGFSNEVTGNTSKAEEYYKAILNINPNNYEGNYALGLLYLNLYLKDKSKGDMLYISKYYLSKANEIDPNELKSLTSLSLLYRQTGDKDELQKINNRINQLKLN